MKKLTIFLLITLTSTIVIDVIIGLGSNYYLNHHHLPGDFEEIDYMINSGDEEMVIIGSSVALNDINPNAISDSLKISCFNGGANAQQFPYYETLLDCMIHRAKRPKYILLALRPDELGGRGLGSRFNILTPYYHRGHDLIDKKLESARPIEPLLLKSSLYRYNTIWWRILLYHFITPGIKGKRGFTGKPVPMIYPTIKEGVATKVSKEREQQFSDFILTCKKNDIEVLVFFPPVLFNNNGKASSIEFVEKFCKLHNILCIDDSQNQLFLCDSTLFYDNTHLNIQGCEKYTLKVIQTLKSQSPNNSSAHLN